MKDQETMKESISTLEGKDTVATVDEQIAQYKEMIRLRKYAVILQELNTRMAVGRANELEAFAKIAHFTNQAPKMSNENMVEHEVTEQDLVNNPELKDAGITVGQKISIPTAAYDAFLNKVDQTGEELQDEYIDKQKRTLKRGPMNVVKV